MTHLTPEAVVDALDGAATEATRAHLARCASCRAELAALQDTFRRASRVDDADVSPLCWTHLSARIADAVSATTPPTHPWWRMGTTNAWRWPVMAGVTGAVALASWLVATSPVRRVQETVSGIRATTTATVADTARVDDALIQEDDANVIPADAALRLMTDLLNVDAEASDAVVQGSGWTADDLLPALSDDERRELSRLLTRATRTAGVS